MFPKLLQTIEDDSIQFAALSSVANETLEPYSCTVKTWQERKPCLFMAVALSVAPQILLSFLLSIQLSLADVSSCLARP